MARFTDKDKCEVAKLLGIDASDVNIIRVATNTVMRYKDVFIRVMGPRVLADMRKMSYDYATWLYEAGAPVVRPLEQIIFSEYHIQLWQWHDPVRVPDVSEAISSLKHLHTFTTSYPGELPTHDAFDRVMFDMRNEPRSQTWKKHVDVDFLECIFLVAAHLEKINWQAFGTQALHGDAHADNVMMTQHGPLWFDFDSACRNHRAYDVAKLDWSFPQAPLAKAFEIEPEIFHLYQERVSIPRYIWRAGAYGKDPHNAYQRKRYEDAYGHLRQWIKEI